MAPWLTGRTADREADRDALPRPIEICEEERLVPLDGSSDAEPSLTIRKVAELRVSRIRILSGGNRGNRPHEPLVARKEVSGAGDRIGSTPGDGVHSTSREPALADV